MYNRKELFDRELERIEKEYEEWLFADDEYRQEILALREEYIHWEF